VQMCMCSAHTLGGTCTKTVMCVAAVQVLITCSLIIITCLTWFGWVLHGHCVARRARALRQTAQVELALAGVAVPVGVPESSVQGAACSNCACGVVQHLHALHLYN
jgi:hypothetical protein